MFNPDGGMMNVLIALFYIIGLLASTGIPLTFVMDYDDKRISKKHVIAVVPGLIIYCFLFYVANPSLSFWAVK